MSEDLNLEELITNFSAKNTNLCTTYWYNREDTEFKVLVTFMTICDVEGIGLRLAMGCDRIDALTPYKPKLALKLSTIH
jgi:hypothetical protein